MAHRFFHEGSFDSDPIVLEGSEAHHLLHVLRLKSGDTVELFNGAGKEATAEITQTLRKSVELKITEVREASAKSQVPVILATAVPKGDRFRWLVEKAAELGVARLVPLITERSSVDPGENRLKKLQQTIISAAKQSGQTRLMELAPLQKWESFLADVAQTSSRLIITDPNGKPTAIAELAASDSTDPIVILIGPEGGFSPAEVQAALDQGATPIKLSEGILRIETAALLSAGLIGLATLQAE